MSSVTNTATLSFCCGCLLVGDRSFEPAECCLFEGERSFEATAECCLFEGERSFEATAECLFEGERSFEATAECCLLKELLLVEFGALIETLESGLRSLIFSLRAVFVSVSG